MPTTQDIEAGLAPPGVGSPSPTVEFAPRPTTPYRTPPDRALKPWQVEDRTMYYRAKQQLAQQQAEQTRQALLAEQNAYQMRNAAMRRQQAEALASPEGQSKLGGVIDLTTGMAQQSLLEQEAAKSAAQREFARQYGITPGSFYEGATPLNAPPVGLTGLAAGIGRAAAPLTTEIPGAETVANVAGDVARNVVNYGSLAAGGPLGAAVDIGVNRALGAAGLPQPSNIVRGALSNTAGFLAESLVPTEVWQAALELTPAGFTGGIPALARAVRNGSPEAIAALTRAGEKLGAREEVQRALKQIGEESGALRFGKTGLKTTTFKPAGTATKGGVTETLFTLPDHVVTATSRPNNEIELAFSRISGKETEELGRVPGGNLGALRDVGRLVEDIRVNNPGARITSVPEDARLARVYQRLGFIPTSESGVLQLDPARFGEVARRFNLGEKAAPEVITNAERIAQLTEQQKNIRQMITTLTSTEATRALTGNVKTVLEIAERYPADSPARADLLKVLEPKIAALDPLEQKFVRETLATLPSKEARKAATAAQRAQQAARSARAFEETPGTIPEKVAASFAAKSGKQAQRFEPIGSKFTDGEQAALHDRIVQAWQDGKLSVFERDNLVDALNLLLTGTRINKIRPNNLAPYEIEGLGKVFGPEVEAAIAKSPARYLSNFDKFVDVLNLPRALVTAFDISAAGRQGILLTARNPVEAFKSFAPMIKAMSSEEGFRKTSQNIVNNPKFQDGVAHGLWLSDIGGGAGAEEAFISHIASKLPFVRGSERGYVTYLDNMRMLNYEKMSNRLEQFAATHDGWDVARTDAVKSQIASFLNHATGRGDLKQLDKFVPALNAVFFSPRYFASRFQSVWDMVRPGADSYTRKVAFENLGAFVGTGMAALAALKMTGAADVEMDPRSADFGRIKIGPTRIDFWGGYQPIARYIAQISTGHVKNTSTGITDFANPGESAMRFFRSKLSPAGAMVYDYIPGKQKDYAGNDLIINPRDLGPNKETGALAWNTFATKLLPLSVQDAIQGYHATGSWAPTRANLIRGATGAGVSAVGGGISSYEPTEKQQATVETNTLVDKFGQDARLQDGQIYPTQLDKDWKSPAWQGLFQQEFRELGDTKQYGSLTDLRQAYVDYWAPKKPDMSKNEISAAFDRADPVKQWQDNVNLEKKNIWQKHRNLIPDARKQNLLPGKTILDAIQ